MLSVATGSTDFKYARPGVLVAARSSADFRTVRSLPQPLVGERVCACLGCGALFQQANERAPAARTRAIPPPAACDWVEQVETESSTRNPGRRKQRSRERCSLKSTTEAARANLFAPDDPQRVPPRALDAQHLWSATAARAP